MPILGLIPARGGSRRLPGKNLQELGGVSLVGLAIRQAQASKVFADVGVSSDDPAILDEANRYGAVALPRPAHLSGDQATSISVVRHHGGPSGYDVALLQPTSPFRTADDIRNAVAVLENTGGDAVVSVTDAKADYVFEHGHADRLRPVQSLPDLVVPNGAIYLLTAKALAEGLDWWTGVTYSYWMPQSRSLDIDTEEDLELARELWAGRNP